MVIYLENLEANYLNEALFPQSDAAPQCLGEKGQWFGDMHQFPGKGWTIGGLVSSQCGVPLLSERNGNMVLTVVDNPFSEITCLAVYLTAVGYKSAYIGWASLEFAGKGSFLRDNGFDVALGIDELPNATGHHWEMYDDAGDPFLLTALTLATHHPSGTPSPSCAPILTARTPC